jgi:hypothetical protein
MIAIWFRKTGGFLEYFNSILHNIQFIMDTQMAISFSWT